MDKWYKKIDTDDIACFVGFILLVLIIMLFWTMLDNPAK